MRTVRGCTAGRRRADCRCGRLFDVSLLQIVDLLEDGIKSQMIFSTVFSSKGLPSVSCFFVDLVVFTAVASRRLRGVTKNVGVRVIFDFGCRFWV